VPERVPFARPPGIAQALKRDYERANDRKADKRFYASTRWLRLRRQVLAAQPLCVDCLSAGRYVPAVDVHHKADRKQRPDLSLDPSNLEGLCKSCHNTRRGAETW